MRSETLDLALVEAAFQKRLPQFQGPLQVRKTPTGQSNPTYILTGASGTYVLRRKPDGVLLKSAHAVDREYRVMTALRDTDLPVPRTYYLCEEEAEIGAVYFVMDYVPGRSFLDPRTPELSVEERRAVYDSMNLGLARLHRLDPVALGLEDYGKSGNYFARQLSRWSRQYEASQTEELPDMVELERWLQENLPTEEGPTRLVHGDWRIDNLIFAPQSPELVAVLDWELSTLGNPLADLGTQLMQWSMPTGEDGRGLEGVNRRELGIPENAEYVERYAERAGLNSVPEMSFPVAFAFYRMAGIVQGVKKRAIDGNASNPEQAFKMGEYVPVFARKAIQFITENV
jgi:aminoglycoside phosphotransferase (APT) family kinase protein